MDKFLYKNVIGNFLNRPLIAIIFLSLCFRIINFNFPIFNNEEVRLAYRGYTLSISGKDEFGRFLPIIFNSLTDYQLPVTSYITAIGELLLGKNDLAVRLPFLILSILSIVLTYLITKNLFEARATKIKLYSALILAVSPVFIFISKIPNSTIISTVILLSIFYILNCSKMRFILYIFLSCCFVLISKTNWFILIPFTIFTIFVYHPRPQNEKIKISVASVVIILLVVSLFLSIPQAKRSIAENNLTILNDMTLKNGIEKLRLEGVKTGAPFVIERIIFNKSFYLIAGLSNWSSNISLASYFGQLDSTGQLNFSSLGAFNKILIIPFLIGLWMIIKSGYRKEKLFLIYPLIVTWPISLLSIIQSEQSLHIINKEIVILSIPFIAIIIAYGLTRVTKWILITIILLMFFEAILNVIFISPEILKTSVTRPVWMKNLILQVVNSSNNKIYVSDDINENLVSFIEWYSKFDPATGYFTLDYPYKFRQTKIGNIELIGFSSQFRQCGQDDDNKTAFLSKRDINRIDQDIKKLGKTLNFDNNKVIFYQYQKGICLQ